MISIPKTALIVGVFLAQLSSAAVIQRRDGYHYRPHVLHPVWDDEAATATTSTTKVAIPEPKTNSPATQRSAITTSSTAQAASPRSEGAPWQPAAGSTWQIELSGIVTDTTYVADVWDLDLFDVPQTTIDALHAAGKKVICYFSAGSFEDWRSDAADFQETDKGLAMEGWAGEWWLDTRTANVRSIMASRIALAKSKNCDAVDPDNVDGFGNANGVGLTEADGVDFLNYLADTAHAQGLSIGLKNAAALVDSVLDKMQFHVNEQCIEYDECGLFTPFINAGKPVFHIEYPEVVASAPAVDAEVKSQRCVAANSSGFSTVLKKENLDAWIDAC
ncbi:uncharacterized protein L3040_007869 [Drepanopeziza brunnea f. sp. 'multigermtubi']|uniref:alpha-galactosidase n=1 Tax=Marssonina brunnea f. sp. multigermtubi (strain MB_m1) TaxID=1072389 RepID=K1WPA4_MARBU|nr:uncharacterized protein MBM_07809 [Drepanopeziza brunnea f. sp. 'multigermtubi' MB_m1]EKD14132.1 hypothetical protein MBM_07809 [Drepanopeziza brunnea f. sp. 'multigermtubi' MB_m1]KAJ5035399.1 hypothetical protein L3040_007869 [Drepanopeziza brunnea f. sp. 'multigermtubi']